MELLASYLSTPSATVTFMASVRPLLVMAGGVSSAVTLYRTWKLRWPTRWWIAWIATIVFLLQVLALPFVVQYAAYVGQSDKITRDIQRCAQAGFETTPLSKLCDLYRVRRYISTPLLAYRTVTYAIEAQVVGWWYGHRVTVVLVVLATLAMGWSVSRIIGNCERTATHGVHRDFRHMEKVLDQQVTKGQY